MTTSAFGVEHVSKALPKKTFAAGMAIGLTAALSSGPRAGKRIDRLARVKLKPVKTTGRHVNKSLVDGVYKPVTQLTHLERKAVKAGGQHKKIKGMTASDKEWRDVTRPELKEGHKALSAGTTELGGLSGATIRLGSKSGGRSAMSVNTHPKNLKAIKAHEEAHMKPKRSEYRLHRQIHSDPKKMMREEARADYLASGHYSRQRSQSVYANGARAVRAGDHEGAKILGRMTDGAVGYSQSHKGFGEYADLQDKMMRAGTREGKHRARIF